MCLVTNVQQLNTFYNEINILAIQPYLTLLDRFSMIHFVTKATLIITIDSVYIGLSQLCFRVLAAQKLSLQNYENHVLL